MRSFFKNKQKKHLECFFIIIDNNQKILKNDGIDIRKLFSY